MQQWIAETLTAIRNDVAGQAQRVRHLEENAQATAQGQPTPLTGSTTPASVVQSHKQVLPKPDKFDGDRIVYPIWKTFMANKLRIDGNAMGLTAATESVYASSFLSGQAAMYLKPYQTRVVLGEMSVQEFWNTMDARYEDVHRQKRAGIEYEHLKQGNRPFIEFISDIERLSSEAGYDGWPAEVKISKLEPKLCSELRQIAITGVTTEDTRTYESFVRKLHDLDNRLKSAKMDGAFKYSLTGSRRKSPTRNQRHASPPPQQMAQDTGDAMEWTATNAAGKQRSRSSDKRPRAKPISQKEHDARRAAGACFTCGNKGHTAKFCYYAPGGRTTRTTQTMLTEAPAIVKHVRDNDIESENE